MTIVNDLTLLRSGQRLSIVENEAAIADPEGITRQRWRIIGSIFRLECLRKFIHGKVGYRPDQGQHRYTVNQGTNGILVVVYTEQFMLVVTTSIGLTRIETARALVGLRCEELHGGFPAHTKMRSFDDAHGRKAIGKKGSEHKNLCSCFPGRPRAFHVPKIIMFWHWLKLNDGPRDNPTEIPPNSAGAHVGVSFGTGMRSPTLFFPGLTISGKPVAVHSSIAHQTTSVATCCS